MKDIKNYLEKQAEISKELNDILASMDKIEVGEIESLYKENEILRNRLDSLNIDNVSLVKDRISTLQLEIDNLLLEEHTNKDPNFRKYLINLSTEVNSLNNRLNYLISNLNQMNERHINYINSIENKDLVSKSNISIDLNKDKSVKEDKIKNNSTNNENKIEFKFGSNILNVLGVILILIAFITFGHYVYTNYMNDILKGIFLFGASSIILLLGECLFIKKNPKFGIGISALGVGSLYVALIVNFLVLDTLNSLMAILLTIVITAISILISSKHNSNIIRVIGLLGGYGCLMPLSYLSTTESYITIAMLLIITVFNVYMPMKNSNFTVYSSVLTNIFTTFLGGSYFIDDFALLIYVIVIFTINNIMYINLCKKEGYSKKQHLSLFLTSGYLINLLHVNDNNILIPALILISISLICYYLANKELKSAFYCHGLYISIGLLFGKIDDTILIYHLILALLLTATIYLTVILKDTYMKCASVLIYYTVAITLITSESFLITSLYIIVLSCIVWMLSKNYKENILVKLLKYSLYVSIIIVICFNPPFDIDITIFLTNFIAITFVLVITNVERLKDSHFRIVNKAILIFTFIVASIFGWLDIFNALISVIIGAMCLLLLTNSNYVESKFINKHKQLLASLYITYTSCMFSSNSILDIEVNNLLLSVTLMSIAFANVWIGFKLNILEVRKYGLVLSLIVCSKLILIDFYSYNFIAKTMLFLIIGIVALAISYVYSKLEQELKNKENMKESINKDEINEF